MFGKRTLSTAEKALLIALAMGDTLKTHRTVDGEKYHRLHGLDGSHCDLPDRLVETMRTRGYVVSNKKFPAAVYLLTGKGRRTVDQLGHFDSMPLSTRRYRSFGLD